MPGWRGGKEAYLLPATRAGRGGAGRRSWGRNLWTARRPAARHTLGPAGGLRGFCGGPGRCGRARKQTWRDE